MIIGIGTDIVEVANIARRIENPPFLRLFSDRERAYAEAQPARRAEIYAARWAAKEAFAKALGAGLRAEWPLDEIEIVHDASGRAMIEIGPALRPYLPAPSRIHCSISHTAAFACAFVIIEGLQTG
ncbi:MAG TPA: holo-ACP synthase [Candidatus Bathyarchaeia archaeon]|nr:holo-ACP synthase [Candidatus Bathyarchaeia archaeon]